MKNLVVLLALAAAAGPAVAQTDPRQPAAQVAPTRLPAAAVLLLGAIDVPLTEQGMARAGLTEPVAAAVLSDSSRSRYLRARAVAAVARFRSPAGRALLERVAATDPDDELRIQAVISLARAFGPTDRPGVSAHLEALAHTAPGPVRGVIGNELTRLHGPLAE